MNPFELHPIIFKLWFRTLRPLNILYLIIRHHIYRISHKDLHTPKTMSKQLVGKYGIANSLKFSRQFDSDAYFGSRGLYHPNFWQMVIKELKR